MDIQCHLVERKSATKAQSHKGNAKGRLGDASCLLDFVAQDLLRILLN